MTNPGQSTPWAKLPIPSEGKIPDVPVDLAALADPLDTLLKNVIGGTSAPTGPLSPTLVDASASIGSLNNTQSVQQTQITTLQGQVTALSVSPWAVGTARTTTFSLAGNIKTPTLAHSYQVPSFSQRRLLLVYGNVCLGWNGTLSTAVRVRLQLRPDGSSTYGDRNMNVQTGNEQSHGLFFTETVEAGKSVRIGLAADVFGTAASTDTVSSHSVHPRIYIVALPWTGSAVPQLAI
ncbi:hypothetical protein ABZ281_07865 [Streptomyces sp. NPDC006265]|uniref:hypothetical protein n=1 Tax=Streptomyces sp. NPDC006265 TaxID=3156740 RepID=UPI0033A095D0